MPARRRLLEGAEGYVKKGVWKEQYLGLEDMGQRPEGPARIFGSCLTTLGIWKVWGQVSPGLRVSR